MFSKTLFCRAGRVGAAAATVAARASPLSTTPVSVRLAARTMPLRAKVQIQTRPQSTDSGASSSSALWTPLPEDEPEDVVFTSLYGLRTIELNRPKKYNSLNASMIRKIAPRLLEWGKSDMANIIVIKGAGDKAFCAGGDVAALAEANARGPEGQKWSSDYFALEYKLDHLIATYSKPYVAFMDGITMGGGVGLSTHAPFRIATERTVFAMPETNIGFFPDVGASFFLPRMPGGVGTYLALTSERLTGANVFYAGVATHYLHSTTLPHLEARLAELRFRDYDDLETRLASINATIDEFVTGLPHDQPILLAGELRRAIDRCFLHDSVAEIVASLQAELKNADESSPAGSVIKAWAANTLKTLEHRSPTSVHVTLRQMRVGGSWSIAETFQREHLLSSRFMRHPDFTEGVSSLLIRKEKTRPNWQPSTLDDVQALPQDITEPFFAPPTADDAEPLALLNDNDYFEYPYRQLSLPTEADVEALVNGGTRGPREIVNQLIGQRRGKLGVKEVVEEILARKTVKDERGNASWVYEE